MSSSRKWHYANCGVRVASSARLSSDRQLARGIVAADSVRNAVCSPDCDCCSWVDCDSCFCFCSCGTESVLAILEEVFQREVEVEAFRMAYWEESLEAFPAYWEENLEACPRAYWEGTLEAFPRAY